MDRPGSCDRFDRTHRDSHPAHTCKIRGPVLAAPHCLSQFLPDQLPLSGYPASNGSLPSTRKTFTELLIEYTSTIPTAPGVISTVCSRSSSEFATLTTRWPSFNFAIAARASAPLAPNNFCVATCMSEESGSFITSTKFFPSGHALAPPLQYFTSSASETSASLLPAETTTAMFFTAGTTGAHTSASRNIAMVPRSAFVSLAIRWLPPFWIKCSIVQRICRGKYPMRTHQICCQSCTPGNFTAHMSVRPVTSNSPKR